VPLTGLAHDCSSQLEERNRQTEPLSFSEVRSTRPAITTVKTAWKNDAKERGSSSLPIYHFEACVLHAPQLGLRLTQLCSAQCVIES